MGCLVCTIPFATPPPPAAILVAALCEHIGEAVTLDKWQLACPATGEDFYVWLDKEPNRSWRLNTLDLSGGYLWHATLAVLQQLGGTYAGTLPAWSYKPWSQAKNEMSADELPLDEAHRLGVE